MHRKGNCERIFDFQTAFLKIHDLKEHACPFEMELKVFLLPCRVQNMEYNSLKQYYSDHANRKLNYVQLDSLFTDTAVKSLSLLISKPPDFRQHISH